MIIMFIFVMFVRVPFILPLLPVENTIRGFANLAYRGMTLWETIDRVLFLIGFSVVFFVLTLILLRRKKEYV